MDDLLLLISVVMIVKMGLLLGFYFVLKRVDAQRPGDDHALQYQNRSELDQANIQADKLLTDILTNDEYYQLRRRGYLEVFSPSNPNRIYRIPRNRGRVEVIESGKSVMVLCVQPTSLVPDDDVILMHKLMIEGNEQEYLSLANRV